MNQSGEKLYDLLILGGGPGGYVAAIRARQLGLSVALVEAEEVGGVCLHHGCIPSKTLLQGAALLSAIRGAERFGIQVSEVRADFGLAVARSEQVVRRLFGGLQQLMKRHGVTVIIARGRLTAPDTIAFLPNSRTDREEQIRGRHLLIAAGSRVKTPPGCVADGRWIYTSDEALIRRDLPTSVVVLGGGPIGCEFAYLYAAYGARVALIEAADTLLPSADREVSELLARQFRLQGIDVQTGVALASGERDGDGLIVRLTDGREYKSDALLVAVGRTPNTAGIGLSEVGISTQNGAIVVDEQMHTSVPGVWAIGDVTTRAALAHGAMAQGIAVAEAVAGLPGRTVDLKTVPTAVYCQPQVAWIGRTEAQAKAAGYAVKSCRVPFAANGKAVAIGKTDGFVKVVCDSASDQILGAHLIGHDVTELVGEWSVAIAGGMTIRRFQSAIHPHPTLSETLAEAAAMISGEAIHFGKGGADTLTRDVHA